MPQYSFRCSKKTCKHEFEELCSFSDFDLGFPNIKCPKCGKKKPEKILNTIVHFGNNPDKMNNFEVAARRNMEKAQKESQAAREEGARRGIENPYTELPDITDNGRKMNFIE